MPEHHFGTSHNLYIILKYSSKDYNTVIFSNYIQLEVIAEPIEYTATTDKKGIIMG